MRILFAPVHYVYDNEQFGSEPYAAFNVANELARRHSGSKVITGKNYTADTPYPVVEVHAGQPAGQLDVGVLNALTFTIKYTKAVLKELRTQSYDIVHHVRPFALGSTFNLALLMRGKKVPFVIGSFCSAYTDVDPASAQKGRTAKDILSRGIATALRPMLAMLNKATLRRAAAVVVYDEHTKREVEEYAGCTKVFVIPPGKHTTEFTPRKERESGPLRFVASGSLIDRKGMEFLASAFIKAARNIAAPIELHIYGEGYVRPRLEAIIKEADANQIITLHGRAAYKDMPQIYANSDAFILTQKEESFGQVYVEAMASGLPIITTANTGAVQLLEGTKFSTLVAYGDEEALVDAINQLSGDRQQSNQLSVAARRHFEANYSWDVLIPRYEAVYKHLMEGGHAGLSQASD